MKINRIKFPTNIFGDEPSLWVGEGDMLENAMGVDMDVWELKNRLADTKIEIVTSENALPKGEKEEVKKKDPIKTARRCAVASIVLASISMVLAVLRVLIMEGVIK